MGDWCMVNNNIFQQATLHLPANLSINIPNSVGGSSTLAIPTSSISTILPARYIHTHTLHTHTHYVLSYYYGNWSRFLSWPKTLDQTTQYRKTNHWPILLKLWRSSCQFFKDSSNRKPATAYNPYMIGHVANELRHHKFREDRMVMTRHRDPHPPSPTWGCCKRNTAQCPSWLPIPFPPSLPISLSLIHSFIHIFIYSFFPTFMVSWFH